MVGSNEPSRITHIFIPEVIPLENKGEEAILRGLEDVLFPGQRVHFHILALNRNNPTTVGNLTIYPGRWFYPVWVFREVYLSLNPLDLLNLLGFLFQGLRNRLPFLARRAHLAVSLNERLADPDGIASRLWRTRAKAIQALLKTDYILAGHDSAMGLREAHLLMSWARQGMPFGVFGCGMTSRFANSTVANVYRTMFDQAQFLFFRDGETWRELHDDAAITRACLAPDPAFGMHPASDAEVDAFIKAEGLADFFFKPVIALTVVENAVILSSFTAEHNTRRKAEAHYRLIGGLVDHIATKWGAHVLFLPHCTGPTPRLDDRRVARNALEHARAGADVARVLETPCDARMLKGIIRRCALLIGERTHSLIGAVSTGTPFICLGSSSDKRTREIIGNMCHANDWVYDLKTPSLESLLAFTDTIWNDRAAVRQRVETTQRSIQEDLAKAAQEARARIALRIQKH